MSITIGGIIFFSYFLYLIVKKQITFNKLFVFTLLCEMYIEIGYAIQIGGYINYRTIAEFLLFIFCVKELKTIPKSILKRFWILMCLFLLPVIQLLLFPSNQLVAIVGREWDIILIEGESPVPPVINVYVIQMLIQFFIQGVIFMYILTNFSKKDYLYLLNKVDKMVNLMLVLGLIEFIFVSVFHQNFLWGAIKEGILGFSEGTFYENRSRGGLYELTLFTKETSHYANVLFVSFFIKCSNNLVNNSKLIDRYLLLNFFILAVGMSFTSVLLAFGILAILIAYRWTVLLPSTMKIEKLTLCIGIIAILVGATAFIASLDTEGFFSRRIIGLIEEIDIVTSNMWMMPGVDSLEWSNRVRLLSIYQTILAFLHRPLFGYGVGAVCCHGATAMMLAGCGIVGVYYWAKFYFFSRAIQTKFHPNKKGYLISILVFLFVTVFYSNGVKAFYELSAIMLVICFSVIFTQRKKCVSYFL